MNMCHSNYFALSKVNADSDRTNHIVKVPVAVERAINILCESSASFFYLVAHRKFYETCLHEHAAGVASFSSRLSSLSHRESLLYEELIFDACAYARLFYHCVGRVYVGETVDVLVAPLLSCA